MYLPARKAVSAMTNSVRLPQRGVLADRPPASPVLAATRSGGVAQPMLPGADGQHGQHEQQRVGFVLELAAANTGHETGRHSSGFCRIP